jgi:hypothetical protein
MFSSDQLKTHFETSPTIKSRSLVLAEWNMNLSDNILKLGNYRYRKNSQLQSDQKYSTLPSTYDALDAGYFYTDATDSDITINNGYGYNEEGDQIPALFTSKKDNLKLIYSLEDCIKPFRPRSGINKASYFNNRYLPHVDENLATRPRYYMPSRDDNFKYWTSYRTEAGVERGISTNNVNSVYSIDDTAPFVIYKDPVPTNRIIVKMQTHVGSTTIGNFVNGTSTISDPFFGNSKKSTPQRWKIQYLQNNQWVDAISFNEYSTRSNGLPVIDNDGNVEVAYGLITPPQFENSFVLVSTLAAEHLLPEKNINGYAYLIIEEENERGMLYVWNSGTQSYLTFTPEYKWFLSSSEINIDTPLVNDLTSPAYFDSAVDNTAQYREFCYISGIRIAVESMNKSEATFDLIEMSPRLLVDLSSKTINFTINKSLSDLGVTSLPVGQLLVSTGNLELFDDDQAFNQNNSNSIIKDYLNRNIKFSFYESILDVDLLNNYTVPLKTLYSEGFPQANVTGKTVLISLRDLFFLFESTLAPEILITEASLSYAVSLLLDSIGFSNYSFYRVEEEKDQIIPYFFISANKNVAEILNELAVSTQSAMYFDEYNNFIVMSKNYLLPTESQRETSIELVGSKTHEQIGIIENSKIISNKLPNIISLSSQDKKIYNDGKINYTERYIQRAFSSIQQAYNIDTSSNAKQWVYKPSLLWEVSGDQSTKTVNEKASTQSNYVLSAMPLNSDLSNSLPFVTNNIITNNIIDVGENIYWLTRYQGYFYSYGEILKYDAVEFDITGTGKVWISSNQEYQKYFGSLPFNGKIYATGLIRIYATPYYENIGSELRIKNGPVFEHGRGQFGTPITTHPSGLSNHWSNNNNVRGCFMSSEYLFNINETTELPSIFNSNQAAGVNNELAKGSTRNSIIKNFLSTTSLSETEINNLQSTQTGTVQASAFVMNGPSFKTTETPLNFLSYVYKPLDSSYKHFGTRMRIIGKLQNNETQTALGSMSYYQIPGAGSPEQSINIAGGSGGIAVGVDEKTNNGYYFEIIALTGENVDSYNNQATALNNVIFYKIQKDASDTNPLSPKPAVPIKLYGGIAKIIVDDGTFVGQQRVIGEDSSTVYDLAVEYRDIDKIRKFYLYINNQLIAVVDDENPIPMFNNTALFVRGSSKCIFENVYALEENYSQNTVFTVGEPLSDVFGSSQISVNNAFSKYAISGLIQSTYLTGVSSEIPPKYNIYYDEFGSIMRECAYFDIKYDKAYPALYAQLAPTFNKLKGYTVSGFMAGAYGAEFLIFNNTDTALSFDESSGNYLRIQGITFTQDTTHQYSVDSHFNKRSNLSDPELSGTSVITSPVIEASKFNNIKLSRINYGISEFSIQGDYIQTQDQAEELMSWIIDKVMVPKKSIGLEIFSNPTIQLGDIVTIDYKDSNGVDMVSSKNTRFVVYNINYDKSVDGPKMSVYLSEV